MAKATDPPAQTQQDPNAPPTPTRPTPPPPTPPPALKEPAKLPEPPAVKPPRFEQAKAIADFKASVLEWMQQHDPGLLLALLERGERGASSKTAELGTFLEEYLADRTKAWQARIRVKINDHQMQEPEAMRLAAKDLFPPEESPADQLDKLRMSRLENVLRAYQESQAASRRKNS